MDSPLKLPHQICNTEEDVRYGYCRCGCGEKTCIPQRSDASVGRIKGVPFAYKSGHHNRILKRYEIDSATGCWNWLVGLNPHGYATIRINGKSHAVFSLLYRLLHGNYPKGLELDHTCRNRRCINPDHLELVTHTENMRRSPLVTKVTIVQVREIKTLLAQGISHRAIARMLNVGRFVVTHISMGRTWKDVDG